MYYPQSYIQYPYKFSNPYTPSSSYPFHYRARGPRYNTNPLHRPNYSSAPYYYNQTSQNSLSQPKNSCFNVNCKECLHNMQNSNMLHVFNNSNVYKAEPYRPRSAMGMPTERMTSPVYPRRPSSVLPMIVNNPELNVTQKCSIPGCACNSKILAPKAVPQQATPQLAKTEEFSDASDDSVSSQKNNKNNNSNKMLNRNSVSQTSLTPSMGPIIEQYLGYV